jgi:hypothetical protein
VAGVAVTLSVACASPAATVSGLAPASSPADTWRVTRAADLPEPLANNAVAAATIAGRPHLFSFLGIGPTRDHRTISTRAYVLDLESGRWERLPDVPGRLGRLAATAQGLGRRVFVFGGYEVAADGSETTSAATDIYHVDERRYSRGRDAPVPLDDSVSGVWRDRLIYLVSGWSTNRTVTTVQAYDPAADVWLDATPIPGTPVFGHAGGVIDDAIVYCGGARMLGAGGPKYGPNSECFRGDIDPGRPTQVTWRAIAAHPGPPRYRAAAGPVRTTTGAGVLFVGGTANPYNFNGIGYDGRPAEPEPTSWLYDVANDRWIAGPSLDVPTMDHRGLVTAGGAWWTIGGFTAGQTVSTHVARLHVAGPDGGGR